MNFNGQMSQIIPQQFGHTNNNNNPNINNNVHPNINNNRSQSTIFYNNNLNVHPMQPYPLNQSVVGSYIFANQNIPPSPMNCNPALTNTNSHRNLPSTQSTAILWANW